jgi:hypothetical protein
VDGIDARHRAVPGKGLTLAGTYDMSVKETLLAKTHWIFSNPRRKYLAINAPSESFDNAKMPAIFVIPISFSL